MDSIGVLSDRFLNRPYYITDGREAKQKLIFITETPGGYIFYHFLINNEMGIMSFIIFNIQVIIGLLLPYSFIRIIK